MTSVRDVLILHAWRRLGAVDIGRAREVRAQIEDAVDEQLTTLDAAGFEIIPKRNAIQRKHDDLIEQWERERPGAVKEPTP